MSRGKGTADAPPPSAKATQPAASPAAPLKPRRTLFITLGAAFILWVGYLLTMYFTTVYPYRHGGNPATQHAG